MKLIFNLDTKFRVFVIITGSLCVNLLTPVQKKHDLCKLPNPGLSTDIRRYFANSYAQESGGVANGSTTRKVIKLRKENNAANTTLIYSVTT
jgi:hypothetical protein